MNCLLYARVSTDKQAEKEQSIPAQLQAMRQYAHERGWQILQEFVEAGASARTTARPILRELLSRCRDREQSPIEVVLVHKIDRLARNLADHTAIRTLLRQRGIRLASVVENLEESVSGQLVEHIMAAMAEFYSANLSEEVKKGLRQCLQQGRWPGHPPRGYRIVRSAERSSIVVDDVQGPLVRKAFDFCLQEYRGLVDLRRRLAIAGLCSVKSGKPLSNGQLVRLLTNPFYSGMMRWKGELHPGRHPVLVSVDVFEQIQGILKGRTRGITRRPTKLLLTGLAHCAVCGLLVGGDEHRRWKYYRCRGSFKSFERCRSKYSSVNLVHRALELLLHEVTPSGAMRREMFRQLSGAELEQSRVEDLAKSAARAQLVVLRQRENHLTRAFSDGLLTHDGYVEALGSLADERQRIQQRRVNDAPPRERLSSLRLAIARVRTAWDLYILLSQREQRILVETLFERLEIDHTGIVRHILRISVDNSKAA